MKKTSLLLLFGLVILRGSIFAQNPYESLGKVAPVLTLSEGKYEEFMTNDTVVQIGSVLFNRLTNEVVALLDEDSLRIMEADMMTRFLSVDPLGRKYPELTPYQFASNTPISGIDLDGLEFYSTIDENGKTIGHTVMLKIVDNSSLLKAFNEDKKAYDAHIQAYIAEVKKGMPEYAIDIVPELITDPKIKAEMVGLYEDVDKHHREVGYLQEKLKGSYLLVLLDNDNSGEVGYTFLRGGEKSTQENMFTIRATDIKALGYTETNNDVVTKTVLTTYKARSISKMFHTTKHEAIGHGGGLFHPWSKKINGKSTDWDVSQDNPNVSKETIKGNLLNSEANPIKELRSNEGTELTPGQVKQIGESVKKDKKI